MESGFQTPWGLDTAAEIPGCKIIRFDSPLYYANAEYFLSKTEEFTKLSKNRHRAIFAPEDRTRKHSSNSYASETGVVNPGLTPEDNEVFEMSTRTNAAPSSRIVFNPARTVGAPSTVDAATLTIDAQQVPLSHVIIDCSSMCFVDVNGLGAIKQLAARCNEEGVVLFLACCKANMREALALSGFIEELHADHLFVTIHDAVMDVLRWEEDGESGLSSGTSLHGQDDQDLDDEAFSRTSIQHGRRRSSAFFTKPTISNKREAPARSESVPDGKTVRMQENRGTDP